MSISYKKKKPKNEVSYRLKGDKVIKVTITDTGKHESFQFDRRRFPADYKRLRKKYDSLPED